MKKQAPKTRQTTTIKGWMLRISYLNAKGQRENLRGAWLLLYARIWTLTQGASYYGIRAADLGAWAGLRDKDTIQSNLDAMVAAGLIRKVHLDGTQGCGYCAVDTGRRDSEVRVEVTGWMVSELGLKNASEIIAYAMIYSFRRKGCFATPAYIANWIGCSERYAQIVLARLEAGSAFFGGEPLVTVVYDEDTGKAIRRPNRAVYGKFVEAARSDLKQLAGPDVWEELKTNRARGHRLAESAYKDALTEIGNAIIAETMGGDQNG